MYVENILIGSPIADPALMFALDDVDWHNTEKDKTYYTNERFLPRILVDIGIYPSVSDIRRNKPENMGKAKRKQRPQPPWWWNLDNDNCWFCKNRKIAINVNY